MDIYLIQISGPFAAASSQFPSMLLKRYEKLGDLLWDFSQQFLSQNLRVSLEFIERHELHNISGAFLPVGVNQSLISIQGNHAPEVCVPDPYNYYRHGQVGVPDNNVLRCAHVMDLPISQDQQYLVSIRALERACTLESLLENGSKVGGA